MDGEHSYFVIRSALKRYVRIVISTPKAVDDSKVKKCAKSMKPMTDVYVENIVKRLRNKYSSLLFRNLILIHCATDTDARVTPTCCSDQSLTYSALILNTLVHPEMTVFFFSRLLPNAHIIHCI